MIVSRQFRKFRKLIGAIGVIGGFLPLLSGQTQDPWFGTWRLNFARSTADRDRQFKKITSRIEPYEDGLRVIYDLVGTRGGVIHMEWTGKFDGKDYPVQGVDYVLTNAYTRVNDRTYQILVKVDGVLSASTTVEVSVDGKTLTTHTGNTTAVYDRQ